MKVGSSCISIENDSQQSLACFGWLLLLYSEVVRSILFDLRLMMAFDLDGTKMSVTHELVGSRLFINSLSQFKKSMCHKLRTTQTVLFENFKTNKER
jgi:hypothetical protein